MLDYTKVKKNEMVLHEMGIKNPTAHNLARLEWVNESYIKAHVQQAVEVEGQLLGLAIVRMLHNAPVPEEQKPKTSQDVWDMEKWQHE
jgi:hypothetical protein